MRYACTFLFAVLQLSKKQFQGFLIESPFPWTPPEAYPAGQCPPCGMGTFHQQYWLDGEWVQLTCAVFVTLISPV